MTNTWEERTIRICVWSLTLVVGVWDASKVEILSYVLGTADSN
jgi:hypothetical protein